MKKLLVLSLIAIGNAYGTSIDHYNPTRIAEALAPSIKKKFQEKEEVKKNIERLLQTNECANCNLKYADLSNAMLNGAKLEGANLRGANLAGAHLNNAHLQEADLSKADLSDTKAFDANFDKANFNKAKLISFYAPFASFIGASFDSDTIMEKCTFRWANFYQSSIDKADIRDTESEYNNFEKAIVDIKKSLFSTQVAYKANIAPYAFEKGAWPYSGPIAWMYFEKYSQLKEIAKQQFKNMGKQQAKN